MNSIAQNIIKHRIGLLNLATEPGNVSRACKEMGFSRDTFYRYQATLQSGGVQALIDANRRKPNLHNRIQAGIEQAVTAFALEQPAFGQVRVCNELRKRGVFVSASGVRCVWLRHNLRPQGDIAIRHRLVTTGAGTHAYAPQRPVLAQTPSAHIAHRLPARRCAHHFFCKTSRVSSFSSSDSASSSFRRFASGTLMPPNLLRYRE